MFQHFTEKAQKAMSIANEQAQRFNHKYIGTEHIFLGLLKQDRGKAAVILKNLGVDTQKMLSELEQLFNTKDQTNTATEKELPQKQHAKKVVEYAAEEARNSKHDCIGTEHILLGLLRQSEGIAAMVLANLGVTIEKARMEIENLHNYKEQ